MTEVVTITPYQQKMLVECVQEACYRFRHLVEYPSAVPLYVTAVSPDAAIAKAVRMLAEDKARWA